MSSAPRLSLETRARRIRASRLRARYAFGQRNHAAGTWYRLRRLLVDAERAFVIPESVVRELEAEGRTPAPAGLAFEPPLRLFVLPAERLAEIATARRIPVRLSAEFLQSSALALLPFQT